MKKKKEEKKQKNIRFTEHMNKTVRHDEKRDCGEREPPGCPACLK